MAHFTFLMLPSQGGGYVHVCQTVWLTYSNNIAMITHGEEHVFRGRPRPHPKGVGPSIPQISGTSCMRAHNMRNNNRILHGDQTRCEANFYTVDHECWCVICLLYLTFLFMLSSCHRMLCVSSVLAVGQCLSLTLVYCVEEASGYAYHQTIFLASF